MRHTEHKHPDKELASSSIFKYGDDQLAAGCKLAWLQGDDPVNPRTTILKITGNVALTALLDKFRRLVKRSLDTGGRPLTYDAVEALFVEALADKRWPDEAKDGAKKFVIPDPRTRTVVVGQPVRKLRTRSKQPQAAPVPAARSGTKRKSKPAEEPPARPSQRPRRAAALSKRGKRG